MAELEPVITNANTFDGQELRRLIAKSVQPGVVDAGDLKVTASGGSVVSVALGTAYLPGTGTDAGLYCCRNDAAKLSSAFEGGGFAAPHGSFARLDQVIAKVWDHQMDGLTFYKWRLQVLTGSTPSQNATLDNRHNAAALPANAIRLADVVMPTSGTVTSNEIRDRRPWAQGASYILNRTSDAGATDDYEYSTASMALIDSTNFNPRIECSGKPVRMTLSGRVRMATAGNIAYFAPWVDGAALPSQTQVFGARTDADGIEPSYLHLAWTLVPSAGSHRFGWAWMPSAAIQAVLTARASSPLQMTVEEIVKPNASND
jgi:hypothetical protein